MENMLIGILSIFFGMQFGLVFSQFFLLVTAKITHVPGIYLYLPINAFVLTTIVFLSLFIIVSTFTPMLIRTKSGTPFKTNVGKQKKKTVHTRFFIWCDLFIWWVCFSWKS